MSVAGLLVTPGIYAICITSVSRDVTVDAADFPDGVKCLLLLCM